MRIYLATFILAGCSTSAAPTSHAVPSASITPHLDATTSSVACGEDIALDGNSVPDLRYAFTYDAAGELTHADGVYAAGGANDSIDYSYDAGGNFTHMLETRGLGDSHQEITASYDSSDRLLDYAWAYSASSYQDAWTYAFSAFTGDLPAREDVTEQGQPALGYTLVWGADGRLAQAVPDTGPATTYTYDDAAGTLTIDTGAGAFHGVIAYDADGRELSETWGGTDPSAVASTETWTWTGDDLDSIVYTSSGYAEADTFRYTCAAARSGVRGQHLPATRARSMHR